MSGKNEILQKCQGNVREFLHFNLMNLECFILIIFFAKFIKFLAPVLSGKFEFVSGKCQGIWSVLNV